LDLGYGTSAGNPTDDIYAMVGDKLPTCNPKTVLYHIYLVSFVIHLRLLRRILKFTIEAIFARVIPFHSMVTIIVFV
jgi:hypothetical protein